LILAADANGYDVMLTVDHGMPHQQPRGVRRLALILVHSSTNRTEDLLPLVDAILDALEKIKPGEIVSVPSSV
jgi:hypothetical protein